MVYAQLLKNVEDQMTHDGGAINASRFNVSVSLSHSSSRFYFGVYKTERLNGWMGPMPFHRES